MKNKFQEFNELLNILIINGIFEMEIWINRVQMVHGFYCFNNNNYDKARLLEQIKY